VSKLAVGGMAEIFLARQREVDPPRLTVIKRVLPHLAEDERFVAMFRDEARLAARIEHGNVCRVYELGAVGDTYFIAMEYLHGMPLSRVLLRSAKEGDPLDFRFVARIIVDACRGLHHAHNLSSLDGKPLDVVHRDISPPNIFLTDFGVIKLLDFGVAKARGASQLTKTGTVKGKNSYMSPEQILGDPVDRRSDIFSLGIVMYECLTSSRLFSRDSDFMTFKAITEADVPDIDQRRSGIPLELKEVLYRALSRDRNLRFATSSDMGDAVETAMANHGGLADNGEIAGHLAMHFHDDLEDKRMLCAEALGLGGEYDDDEGEATVIDAHPHSELQKLRASRTPRAPVLPQPVTELPAGLPTPARPSGQALDEETMVDLSAPHDDDDAPTVVRTERTPTPAPAPAPALSGPAAAAPLAVATPPAPAAHPGDAPAAHPSDAPAAHPSDAPTAVEHARGVSNATTPVTPLPAPARLPTPLPHGGLAAPAYRAMHHHHDSNDAMREFADAQRSMRLRRMIIFLGVVAVIVTGIVAILSNSPG
jgi:serine/threonine-protein kinase